MLEHLAVFVVALATVVIATPLVRLTAVRLGAIDNPEARRVHERPTPTLGGLALFAGVLAAIGAASQMEAFRLVFRTTNEPEAIVFAGLIIVVVGAIDDIRDISAPAKIAGQILAAGVLVLFGLSLQFVYIPGPMGTVNLSPDFASIVTIVAIVAMVNAVNLVDGLDGLAAGIVAIAAVALFAYTQYSDAQTLESASAASLVLAATAGACLGFLFYNFSPASIFMGDTGAMLLGLLLGAAGISSIANTVTPTKDDFTAISLPVLVPALVLAVPFLDTVWAILRRLRRGRPIAGPDKQHLHHRLLEIGNSQRRAVLIMYYWSGLIAFAAVGSSVLPQATVVRVLVSGIGFGVVYGVVARGFRWAGRRRARLAERDAPENVLFFTKSRAQREKTQADQRKRADTDV